MAFSPDGRHVGVAWGDKSVRIYNYLRHEYVTSAQLETHPRCLVFSPDGKRIGMEAHYGLVQMDVAPDAPFHQTLKAEWTEWLAYSPDGKRVAIGGEPPAIYDVATGKRLVALGLEKIYRPRFVFSPDGKSLHTVVENGAVVTWEWE